ncbi:dicarboxylate/amino acid:cation symporter [Lysinibacillus irui]|uniref:Dicarboxylate/amino acid:cation symporter n=1 Tax=Lysinibacillus irui TaxID=2998077 RepID=A0AAJ5RK35_9BACI|nr:MULTISPECIES: dicarboxylate/amino acid:cation symporter [Lysinibacillus]MEA0555834.1 dicarboxylate/amino acid:cation symporter [Lysinibacillus irui]MEA0566180.1 dicarboxylate/amino acid:cation symporter [Lysinibacillus irui]MEA0976938.1 dicarboxylate/amino acid:cation symporter [Lysinibacillus irui]MEA1043092.1 dicarboxylate/amino acid:cation symporter [Lysinibacillus irui]WDV06450.1 dicarboxylate/amino acid:cation symporter [Lysinibacillus irui]
MGKLRAYRFSMFLLIAILLGVIIGLLFGEKATVLKPFGDIFINLLFMIVVPLVFFSIASSVASMESLKRLGKIMGSMMLVFIATGIIAAIIMLIAVTIYPPGAEVSVQIVSPETTEDLSFAEQLVNTFTVPDFMNLLSRSNMLALILFAVLIGLGTGLTGEAGKPFARFLISGSEVFMKVIKLVMYYAPIGLMAYFATLIGDFGAALLGDYAKAIILYYPVAILYFLIGFTLYAFIAGGKVGVIKFWQNILTPAVTALGTGSSFATLPVNLTAAKQIGVPKDIRETVLPLGATIHMDGSCLSAILKIAFVFGVFNMDFTGFSTFVTAIGVALLSGIVMSGIPGGGFIGEMLIVTLYGLPVQALPMISAIGVVVDPPATMVNATGDTVASMIVTRTIEGKDWIQQEVD